MRNFDSNNIVSISRSFQHFIEQKVKISIFQKRFFFPGWDLSMSCTQERQMKNVIKGCVCVCMCVARGCVCGVVVVVRGDQLMSWW